MISKLVENLPCGDMLLICTGSVVTMAGALVVESLGLVASRVIEAKNLSRS